MAPPNTPARRAPTAAPAAPPKPAAPAAAPDQANQAADQAAADQQKANQVEAELEALDAKPADAPTDQPGADELDESLSPEERELARKRRIAADEAKLTSEVTDRSKQVQANIGKPALSPATAVPKEETVTMVAPRPFLLQLDDGRKVQFVAGPQEVCVSLSTHQYVADNGCKLYEKA